MIARENIVSARNQINEAIRVAEREKNAGIRQYDEILNDLIRELERIGDRMWMLCHEASDSIPVNAWHTKAVASAVLHVVESEMGYLRADVLGRDRTKFLTRARHIAIYAIRKMANGTLQEIGNVFGRDHSSILHAIDKIGHDAVARKASEEIIEAASKRLRGEVA